MKTISQRRVASHVPKIKNHISSSSGPSSPASSSQNDGKVCNDENLSIYSFPSRSPHLSPISSPEGAHKLSAQAIQEMISSPQVLLHKPPLKLYFKSRNVTPLTPLKWNRLHQTNYTSLILLLKSTQPHHHLYLQPRPPLPSHSLNLQDLLTILHTIPNSVNERDDDGMTALMLICSSEIASSSLSIAERFAFCSLIKEKYPKQFELTDNHGLTALHHAVQFTPSPSLRIIQLLLSAYPLAASVLDLSHSLPLHHAVVGTASNSILKLLILASPTSVTAVDGTGLTALDYLKTRVKIPSRRTRALLSSDGVWMEPELFTRTDCLEPDPEEIFAAFYIQSWFRKMNKAYRGGGQQQQQQQPKEQQGQSSSRRSFPLLPSHRPQPKPAIPTTKALSSWHHDAATMIQARVRGSFLRLRIIRGTESILTIQRLWRGYFSRQKIWKQYPIKYQLLSLQRTQRQRRIKQQQQQQQTPLPLPLKSAQMKLVTEKKGPKAAPSSSADSATVIRSYWLRYKAKKFLASLSYHTSLSRILIPFYLEALILVAVYWALCHSLSALDKTFTEKELIVSALLSPINSLTQQCLGTSIGHVTFSFQLAEMIFLFTLLSLSASLFILRSLYLILPSNSNKQILIPSTPLFHSSARPLFLFSSSLSLLSLTLSWLLSWIVVYSHFESLLQITMFSLPFGPTIGGLILSLGIIPLVLYLPTLSLVFASLLRGSKWSYFV
jgi:hypothetical protein